MCFVCSRRLCETDIKDYNPWVESAISKLVSEFRASMEKYPVIASGTPDPCTRP